MTLELRFTPQNYLIIISVSSKEHCMKTMASVVYATLEVSFRWSTIFPMNAELNKHLIKMGFEPNKCVKLVTSLYY